MNRKCRKTRSRISGISGYFRFFRYFSPASVQPDYFFSSPAILFFQYFALKKYFFCNYFKYFLQSGLLFFKKRVIFMVRAWIFFLKKSFRKDNSGVNIL